MDCALARWAPQLGDPTLLGWALTLGYGVAALVCFRAPNDVPRFFRGVAVIMLLAMINKQMDLHVALTALGRCAAQAQGWFGARRAVQLVAVLVLLGGVALALLWVIWSLRAQLGQLWLVASGLAVLAVYVGLRAAGLLHLDDVLGVNIVPGLLLLSLEAGGIVLIIWAGLRA